MAHQLKVKLEAGGLLEGDKAPRTDMDTAMYELGPDKPFQIGNNAQVLVNDYGNFALTLSSTRDVASIVEGLDAAIASAKAYQDRRSGEKAQWAARVQRDKVLEKAEPVFSPQEDVIVISDYLTGKVEEVFPRRNPNVEYSAQGKVSGMPEFSVTLEHTPEESFAQFNDFHGGIRQVFDGLNAVMPHTEGSNTDDRVGFTVVGNPARLLGDINRNDPDNFPQGEIKRA